MIIKLKENEMSSIVKDGVTYYLNDSYIRKELMNSLVKEGMKITKDSKWLEDNINLESYYYSKSVNNSPINILQYMIETYPELYNHIYDAYQDVDLVNYHEMYDLLKESLEFSLRDKIESPFFQDNRYDDTIEDLPIETKELFDRSLLESEINIYDENTNKYTSSLITKAEAIYLSELLENNTSIYSVDYDDVLEYINDEKPNITFYYSQNYYVYQLVNFDTLNEKFAIRYPELSDFRIKDTFKYLKGHTPSARKEYRFISKINNNTIKKIVNEIYSKNKDLDKTYTYRELNPLIKNNPILQSGFSNKIVNDKKIIDIFPNGFSINDLLSLDESLPKQSISKISIFRILKDSDLIVEFTKWNSRLQRIFLDKPNHVFQLNLKNDKYDEILDYVADINDDPYLYSNIKKYMNTSMHPISRSKLTLAWIRFTKINDSEIVIDEIQTDLDNPSNGINTFNSAELMDGWEDIILSKFIKFVRYNLDIRKIYYPTITTKKDRYKAKAPTYLYSDLPKKYGFSNDNSKLEGFMLLEKKIKRDVV